MKLHLGCGGNYLPGYINIDFPQSKHRVQKVKADVQADILSLRYPSNSITEIRLHHVYEHFPRAIAYALLGIWNSWLNVGGILCLEVPDFEKNAEAIVTKQTGKKNLLLRHIFGSQEASWAIHYHGWTEDELKKILSISGYKLLSVKVIGHKGMFNLNVLAQKAVSISKTNFTKAIGHYLDEFLVDDSKSEKTLKSVWVDQFKEQINNSWGT